MASYAVPQVRVFQQSTQIGTAAETPLHALIIGGNAKLIRYGETDEQALGKLDYYDPLNETAFTWPNRPAGAKVDLDYTKVYVKNALLRYFQDNISADSLITKVSGYNNRIRSATVNFVENGSYDRAAVLLDRDVQIGDVAKVRAIDENSDSVTLWTYVKDIIGDTVAAVVDDASASTDNVATQSADSSTTQIAGAENCIEGVEDISGFDGRVIGTVNETYDIVVTESSVGGDLTTARLRVISGSGKDDVAEVIPSALGDPTEIGNYGLEFTFQLKGGGCSESAEDDSVSPNDLIAGQKFRVTIAQAFTAPTATSGGTYSGSSDTTYIVTVTRGGLYASATKPQITVTTNNGIDRSGPTNVTAASTNITVGTKGVTMSFNSSGLRAGDVYYIEAFAADEGPMRTIVLGHNLSTEITAGSQVDLTLYIKKADLLITKHRTESPPDVNYTLSATEVTLAEGITAFDSSWTDAGEPVALPVISEESKAYGMVYVEYRAWLSNLVGIINSVDNTLDLDDIPGVDHPDNPLKYAVVKALANSNGVAVKYVGVADPSDIEAWTDALEPAVGDPDVYGIVPLTRDADVLTLVKAHVESQSGPDEGYFRVMWASIAGVEEIPVISAGSTVANHTAATTSDGEEALCVIEDDSDTSGTQYTILRCTSANADFLANNVRAGDVVRVLYTTDGFDGETYSEYVIDDVQAEDQLRLVTGPAVALSLASKFEVWRTLFKTDESSEIALQAGAFGHKRVRAVWPDTIEVSGTSVEGYHLCAALAGLASGVLPHQPLTNVAISGFTTAQRTTRFNGTQLNTMAASGCWIVTQDPAGTIKTRHALTTGDQDNINDREESCVRNLDSISFQLKDLVAPYIGIVNVVSTTQDVIQLQLSKKLDALRTETFLTLLGGQLTAAEIAEFREHATLKDRYVIVINATLPKPFNNADLYIVV